MKKISMIAMTAVLALAFTSCASIGTTAGVGVLYTDAVDPVTATSNSVGTKVGVAKNTNILGLFVTGDASINAAARNGNIKKVSHVDRKVKSFLGIFSTSETVVYGE